MTKTTEHGLICLEDTDYGALALTMQADAGAIDAALDGISDSLDTYSVRPYVQATTTVGNGPLASAGEQLFNLGAWSNVASNIPGISFSGIPVSGGIFRFTSPRSGWYEFGAYVNLLAAGAVTAFSRRTLFVTAFSAESLTATPTQLDQISWRTGDTNTAGGEFLVASGGMFYARAGGLFFVSAQWSHANLASNVSSLAGARAWMHFVGSGIEIGSA